MATFVLKNEAVFAQGVTATVYPKSNWPFAALPPSGSPVGSSTTSAVVASDGTATFAGLADNVAYYAYAATPDRYVAFFTGKGAAAQDVIGDFFDIRRSSEVRTLPRELALTPASALGSGTIYTAPAIVRTSGTFTKARWMNGATAASGITAARLGVWNDSNVKLADVALSTTAGASALFDNIALGSSLALVAGQQVWLGIVFVGTTPPSIKGYQGIAAANALAPALSRFQSGYASGALPDPLVPGGASTFVPWIELIP